MPEPLKKYENLIEMAFRFIESGAEPTSDEFMKLRAAVEALKDFRAAREPIFVLRGQDHMAPYGIKAWGYFTTGSIGDNLLQEHATHEYNNMRAWQEAHPNLVKMPD